MQTELLDVSVEIDAIMQDKKQLEDASDKARDWFDLTCHNLSLGIADTPENEQAALVHELKGTHAWWMPRVLPLAREIIRSRKKQ